MAKTCVTRIIQTVDGDGVHDPYEATQITSADASFTTEIGRSMNSGDNVITPPLKASSVLIENASQIYHISASAAVGNAFPCAAGATSFFPVTAGLAFVINFAAPGTIDLRWR